MTERQRHHAILALLAEQSPVSVHDLIARIGMSPATARRDLHKLAQAGQLLKVRNGAERIDAGSPAAPWLPLDLRNTPHLDAKYRIAREAATLLSPGDSVVINCGSTAFLLGQQLCGRPVQLITNYFPLASYLVSHDHADLILMGGQYDHSQGITIGDDQSLRYAARWMFTSGSGLTADGLYKANIITALSEQKVMRGASKLVVLADGSKVGQGSGMLFAAASDIAMLITSTDADAATVAALRARGVEVRQV
ncbi:DeoR family ulaG and ulaABCDEF operon transcriptional repressor [Silvimonas terrae]|uniref:DeoR family ulaG and ulaABCDEF operon transcriptional repressor n=1 Tax=Silvimonas terrae TaxID=300266 RepID=A0A840RF94_9NEIS|nr:HTH-type transcriptional regulator UlaR [Silvimonas terrae]MBB5192005.1 DeoR family ulaG and ulaABCDEF operon transcriptional repressor [Silvimonas terrae]